MYYINGIDEIQKTIQNVCGIIKPFKFTDNDYKSAYNDFLKEKSVFEVPIKSSSIYLTDFSGLKRITPRFYVEKEKFFDENSDVLKKRINNGFFNRALLKLKKQCEDIYNLARFIIRIILINKLKSYTNGTTHETIGLSSIDFKDNFDDQDFIELVVHQLTHMILFIDDDCNPHMVLNNKEVMIDTRLQYKLGGNQFPAYIAFHGYIVGVEILCFRQEVTGLEYSGNYHGNTERIIRICNEFQCALEKKMGLFSRRGQLIFEKAKCILSQKAQDYQYRIETDERIR